MPRQKPDDLLDLDEIEETPQPRRGRASRHLDGDGDSPDEGAGIDDPSVLAQVLLDPEQLGAEDEFAEGVVSDDEIAEADSFELGTLATLGARKSKAMERDSYEEWVRMSHEPRNRLRTPEEMESLLNMARSSDPEIVAIAEDRLIRCNIRWIVKCLQRVAGGQIMNRPNQLREDLLSLGRWGFLIGIRKYDPVAAAKRGGGQKANLLTYSRHWIEKLSKEHLGIEKFGLKDDAAQDRSLAVRGRDALRRDLGRDPTYEEIAVWLEDYATQRLAKQGVRTPSKEKLRRRGALTVDRIKELLEHATQTLSIDAPIGGAGAEAGSPTIGEYVPDEADDMPDRLAAEERVQGVLARLNLLGNPRHQMYFRMFYGVGDGGMPVFNPTEIGLFAGRGRDSVRGYAEQIRSELWGEASLDAEARPWIVEGSSVPSSIGADVRRQIDLRRLVRDEGVRLDPTQETATATCPLEPGAKGQTLRVEAERFECTSCGRTGDVFDWLVERRGLTRSEALVEGMRLTTALPRGVRSQTVVTDPVRARRLGVHR